MVNIGIIGAGKVVQNAYLPGFAAKGSELSKTKFPWYDFGGCDNGRVISLCGKNIGEARDLAVKYNIPRVSEDWRAIVDDEDIDAVCVATPNYLHAEIAIAAAESGNHVLVEKPMAVSLHEADAMIEAATKNNVVLMVEQTFRFVPAVDVAYHLVNSGILGRIISVKSKFGTPGPDVWAPGSDWFFSAQEAGYGSLLDVGIHGVDLVRYLSGKNVQEVAAIGGTYVKDIKLDDNSICLLKFEDGTFGIVEASWTSILDISVVVNGERGLLEVRLGDKRPVKLELASESFVGKTEISNGKAEVAGIKGAFEKGSFFPDIPSESEYRGPFQYFIDCILKGKKPFVSGEEGRADLEIVLAGYQSMKDNCFVSLPM